MHVTYVNMRYMDMQFKGRVNSRRPVQKSCPHMRLFAFLSSLDSELIKFEWLYDGLEILIPKHM